MSFSVVPNLINWLRDLSTNSQGSLPSSSLKHRLPEYQARQLSAVPSGIEEGSNAMSLLSSSKSVELQELGVSVTCKRLLLSSSRTRMGEEGGGLEWGMWVCFMKVSMGWGRKFLHWFCTYCSNKHWMQKASKIKTSTNVWLWIVMPMAQLRAVELSHYFSRPSW